MSKTVAQINTLLDQEFKNRNFAGKCEAARYQITRLTNGLENMTSFPSAKAARLNSKIVSRDRTKAQPGDVGFWDKTENEHDLIALGNDLWIGATVLGDTVLDLGNGIKVIHGSTYPATFLGYTERVGNNPPARVAEYKIAKPGTTPAGVKPPKKKYALNPPKASVQKRIQVALRRRGRYSGPRNGVFGKNTWRGIQRTVANVGYSGPQNGVPGEQTALHIQEYAAKFGRYKGPVNGILGPNSWEGFARGLEAGLK